MKDRCIICVDGGATKTEVVAYTYLGEEIARFIGDSGNFSTDINNAKINVFNTINQVFNCIKENYECIFIQMGISGYGAFLEKDEFIKYLESVYDVKVNIVDDAKLALFSILKDKYDEAILILAGTGSACYGYQNGNNILVGGWGYLLGDEGSSYHTVMETFKMMINDYDNGKFNNTLTTKMLKYLKLDTVLDLKKLVYKLSKREIAQYSLFINQCADSLDEYAINILNKEATALANFVITVYNRLELPHDVIIGCQGSFILKSKTVNTKFKECVKNKIPEARFIENMDKPVKGAYYLAKRVLEKSDR